MQKRLIVLGLIASVAAGVFAAQKAFPLNIEAIEKATYVGSKACEICHKDIFNSWKATLHTRKIQIANEYSVVGDFISNNKIIIEKDGQKYVTTMKKKDSKYFVETYGSDMKLQEYPISYTIGGTWKQRYITIFPNGAYMVLPVQWNVKTGEWVDYHGFKTANPGSGKYWSDKNRTWQYQCGSCHVTGLEFVHDEKTDVFKSTKWVDNGAACEACHGPGSKHLEAANEFERRETIVAPRKLATFVGAMVCGSCHNRGFTPDKKFEYPKGYKPGKMLTEYYVEKPGEWPNGNPKQHHQQYNDWKKSGHATNGVNCWTCHEFHKKGATERYSLKAVGDALCLNCHRGQADTKGGKSIHAMHSIVGCSTCHMPKTAKNAIDNDIADHSFRVILPQTSIEKGGVDKQPNSCNLCHYHKKDSPESLAKFIERLKKEAYEGIK